MFVRVDPKALDKLVDALVSLPEITYVSAIMGEFDIHAQVIYTNNEALWELVKSVRELDGVSDTQTIPELRVHKFHYGFPYRAP